MNKFSHQNNNLKNIEFVRNRVCPSTLYCTKWKLTAWNLHASYLTSVRKNIALSLDARRTDGRCQDECQNKRKSEKRCKTEIQLWMSFLLLFTKVQWTLKQTKNGWTLSVHFSRSNCDKPGEYLILIFNFTFTNYLFFYLQLMQHGITRKQNGKKNKNSTRKEQHLQAQVPIPSDTRKQPVKRMWFHFIGMAHGF